MNITIFQFFHWYYSPEGNLWCHVAEEAGNLANLGITHCWLPPAYKSAKGVEEPGYAVYDLFDLGEFNQKGTIRTRYGTKAEYLHAIEKLHAHNIGVIADLVLNHRMGGDETELIFVKEVDEQNRKAIHQEEQQLSAYTRFTFPGRQQQYSDFIWDKDCFTGLCHEEKIYLIQHQYSKGEWDTLMEEEKGNFDFLMGNDLEFRNPYVVEELKKWGRWYVETTQVDGFRLDALKHINPFFYPEWIDHLQQHFKKMFFVIGEYWQYNVDILLSYIDTSKQMIQLFDVPLHCNFHYASIQGKAFDLRTIFDNTLIQKRPDAAISFVDNHDTQPLQSLESPVENWFKPLAYALILLRQQGIPCVFYPSVYNAQYFDHKNEQEVFISLEKVAGIDLLLQARKQWAYGEQWDYFDDPNLVGWTRLGIGDRKHSGLAVLISNGEDGQKRMSLGALHGGKTMVDALNHRKEKITLQQNGEADFFVSAGSVSVWIFEDALENAG